MGDTVTRHQIELQYNDVYRAICMGVWIITTQLHILHIIYNSHNYTKLPLS